MLVAVDDSIGTLDSVTICFSNLKVTHSTDKCTLSTCMYLMLLCYSPCHNPTESFTLPHIVVCGPLLLEMNRLSRHSTLSFLIKDCEPGMPVALSVGLCGLHRCHLGGESRC